MVKRIHGFGLPETRGTPRRIVNPYVSVGAAAVALDDIQGLAVGDTVTITRPSTQEWIAAIGCDTESIG